jgi:hypothetical protein
MQANFPFVTLDNNAVCDICHLARHKRLAYKLSNNKASKCGELIHFDIWGPTSVHSLHGHRYFLTAVDDHSRFTWVILLKSKSEVGTLVMQFVKMIETQFNALVKTIRTDNGPEFLIPQFYASRGINHQTSCVETPQQNGRVERKHQHLLNVGRSLLFQSKLPTKFWSYAIVHATYIINRVCTPLLHNKSPYHILYDKPPDLSQLKVFGSLYYASTLSSQRTKFDPRARKCIFLGYKSGMKGDVLFDIHHHNIFVSRNIIHHDHILPYTSSTTSPNWHYHLSYTLPLPVDQTDTTYQTTQPSHDPDIPSTTNDTSNTSNPPLPDDSPSQIPISTRPVRTKHVPSYLSDFVCN